MTENLKLLEVLDEYFWRDLLDQESEAFTNYLWQKNGAQGEAECLAWLIKALPEGVVIYQDLEIKFNGRTQVDLLLVADDWWWVIEVKNYRGVYSHNGQTNELSGYSMQSDQLAAMRNRMRIMTELAGIVDRRIRVEGTMVFIHPECDIKIKSQEDFAIVLRHQFNRHLKDKQAQHLLQRNSRAQEYYERMMEFYCPYPETFPVMTEELWSRMRKGCRCERCNSYQLEATKKFMHCLECGHVVTKARLAENLYCQCCVLLHDQAEGVTVTKVYELSSDQLSRYTIQRVLSKNIATKNKYKYCYLENHKLPRSKMDHIFQEK